MHPGNHGHLMRHTCIAMLLLGMSALSTARDSWAEDLTALSLEELMNVEVISASRMGQNPTLTPTSVSVLTAADIRTFGWRTLAEALNAMRGLYTTNDRNYSYLGVRGFLHPNDYNSRVLIMIDGQRMNENIFDGGYLAQEFMLDIDMVERIEYVPGSGSTIYGANAFLGLINVVTKSGPDINGVQLASEIGSFDTTKNRATYGKRLTGGTDILLSASHHESAGDQDLYFPEFDSPATNNGIAHDMDTERAGRLFGKMQFKKITLSGGLVDRFKRVPTASFGGIFNDSDFYTIDTQLFTNLKYEDALSEKTSALLKGFYQGYDYAADQAYDNGVRTVNRDETKGRWWGGEAQLTSTAFARQRIMLGVEYQYDQRQEMINFDIDPYAEYQNSNRQGNRLELYGQDDVQILDDILCSAGVRLDYHHMLDTLQINPRLGLIWTPLASTDMKLLYSSTFRAPNVWERDYHAFSNVANDSNEEERITSYEGILEWRSVTGLKLMGALFHNDISQLLEQEIDPVSGANGAFVNIGNYQTIGVELEVEKRWRSGRLMRASHTYSRLTDESKGSMWAYASPQNVSKLHYAEPLFANFAKLGVESIYIGERRALQGGEAEAYNLINLNLGSDRIRPGVSASFGIFNLFDRHYQMLGGTGIEDISQNILAMNGREFRFKLQVTF